MTLELFLALWILGVVIFGRLLWTGHTQPLGDK